jgi:Domain of unknown function (DUF4116)
MSDLRSRLNKILELHAQALSEAVNLREPNSQEAQLNAKDLVLRFAGADPTDGKSRTQWLIKTYILDEQFKLEDLGRVDAALAAFERFKRKLPVEQRELSQYKSLRDLEELVAPFVKAEAKARLERDLSSATGREKRRLEELKARDESIVLQEGKGLPTIAVPMTEFASKWWGRGTQWCTAAENNNAFTQYHQDAPLIIIVCPDGVKFQMNAKPNTFLFMDNTDKKVSKETIHERWNEFQSLFYWAIQHDGRTLHAVPEDYRTLELCRLAVEQNGLALYYTPKDYRTPELCRLAVEQNGNALTYVPGEQRTPELCRLAVEQNGEALKYVSEITPELCRIAVEQNGWALQYVPHDLTSGRADAPQEEPSFASKSPSYKDQRTTELCLLAVEQNGEALRHVSEHKKTPELCRIAVIQNGMALNYMPREQKTLDLCRLAVVQNGMALEFVPAEHRTSELCRIAVQRNGRALRHVPPNKKTSELYSLAVQQNGRALDYVPEKKKTFELCSIAVQQDGSALFYVPEKHKTPKLIALISPIQPKWHPDILQGLGQHALPLTDRVLQQI